MNFRTLDEWLIYCEALHPKAIDMGLQRVQQVALHMGLLSFERRPVVVTVAGTNGKGSTCAMLSCIWQKAGYRVGGYSSPHLVSFTERCLINGQPISEADLLPSFEVIEQARQALSLSLTYFEFTTLAILHALMKQDLDVWVLEVGLGGRLDAVNVIDADVAVITQIDLDHTEWLGSHREAIGYEKAGIMRPHRPVVIADPHPPQSLMQYAQSIQADRWQIHKDFTFQKDENLPNVWHFQTHPSRGGVKRGGLATPALRGDHQLVNAASVLAVVEVLRSHLPVPIQALRDGLAYVALLGRFQVLPGQPAVVLDVAHNPHAVKALRNNLDAMGFYPRNLAVFGAMADKAMDEMLHLLAPLIDGWYMTDLPTPRAASADALCTLYHNMGFQAPSYAFGHPTEAYQAALRAAHPEDRIVVFGSFWTVGEMLKPSKK